MSSRRSQPSADEESKTWRHPPINDASEAVDVEAEHQHALETGEGIDSDGEYEPGIEYRVRKY